MNTISSLLKNLRNRTPVGSIEMFGGSAAPTDWLLCNGAAVSRSDYSALYDVIGTTYGTGDGSTTFNLPDFRDKFPVGAGSSYSLNSSGGAATVTLEANQSGVPAHVHGLNNHTHTMYHTHGAHIDGQRFIVYNYSASQKGVGQFRLPSQGSSSLYAPYVSSNKADFAGIYATGGASTSTTGGCSTNTANNNPQQAQMAHENRPPYRGINFIIYAGKTA